MKKSFSYENLLNNSTQKKNVNLFYPNSVICLKIYTVTDDDYTK